MRAASRCHTCSAPRHTPNTAQPIIITCAAALKTFVAQNLPPQPLCSRTGDTPCADRCAAQPPLSLLRHAPSNGIGWSLQPAKIVRPSINRSSDGKGERGVRYPVRFGSARRALGSGLSTHCRWTVTRCSAHRLHNANPPHPIPSRRGAPHQNNEQRGTAHKAVGKNRTDPQRGRGSSSAPLHPLL